MTWLKKLLKGAKLLFEVTAPPGQKMLVKDIESALEAVPGFAKLTAEMVVAAGLNIEQNVARGFRKITGTGGRPVFNTQEGPLKSSVSLQDTVHLAQSAYEDGGGSRAGYDTITQRNVKDLSFSIYRSQEDGHVVVSFRGTTAFSNWKNYNLKGRLTDDGFGNRVHAGFKDAWDTVKPAVDEELFQLFGGPEFRNNVTFTGHSLGGAISQLATAEYMGTQNPRLIDTVTFASPTVGDAGFNERIPGGHMMRVVDPRDSVPKLTQTLLPELEEPSLGTRTIALGDKDKRMNDKIKKDAIKFGIDLAFDMGIAFMLAYAPGAAEVGEEGLAVAEVVEGGLAEEGALGESGGLIGLEEAAVAAAEESAGLGAASEEAAFLKGIGAEGVTSAETADLGVLFNAEARASIATQMRAITAADIRTAVVEQAGKVNWELTMKTVMVKAGISNAAQNIMLPFLEENGFEDVSPEGLQFLVNNGWDFIYGSVQAHPVDTYIDNINNQFGNRRDNAREDMWANYNKNLKRAGEEGDVETDFMTEEELQQFQEGFSHGRDEAIPEPDDEEEDDDEDFSVVLREDMWAKYNKNLKRAEAIPEPDDEEEDDDEDDVGQADREGVSDVHNVAGHEASFITGRPLEVRAEQIGRKSDGGTIFSVVTEDGDVLSYTGPSHPASTTTLYGKWTGIGAFANALPVKVSRQNAFGGKTFSALDTFSMAYLINSYHAGFHNQKADDIYKKRINAALRNGFISDSIDANEHRVAVTILNQFEEKGHLLGAEDSSFTSKGNMLSEMKLISRGEQTTVGDDVKGVPVAFTERSKRRMKRLLQTPAGTGVASDIMTRDSKRLRSSEVSDINISEDSTETIDFNMRALKSMGMEHSNEYAILENSMKQTAFGYKTALNVEERFSELIQDTMRERGSSVFDTKSAKGILPNVLGQYTTRDVDRSDEDHLSGNDVHIADKVVLEILKAVV